MSRRSGGLVPLIRMPGRSLAVLLSVVLLAALLPAAASAAAADGPAKQKGKPYIVTLSVTDAGKTISPSSKKGRDRLKLRAARTKKQTRRLESEVGFKAKQRYRYAVSGFTARLTPSQLKKLKRDGKVARAVKVRRVRPASQVVPRGIKRVKAAPGGASGSDVNADVAVLDTGVGPIGNGELHIAGGENCYFDAFAGETEPADPDDWGDTLGHGTHVAGTIAARDNSIGSVGVAPGARIWSVRVFDGFNGSTATIICGLDWVLGTTLDAGQPDIDLVNMSLEGTRTTFDESCDAGNPDPVHQAVCAVHQAGVTMVAAAGNGYGANANATFPGGYDQVISVGALSDFDGKGGSLAKSDCAGYGSEVDDTYAAYSNQGPDVDIVAPGTCVRSLDIGDPSGDDTTTETGTSMAAPHVTGALARYIDANPNPGPNDLRKMVRAAGRLDWEVASDPDWSPSDLADAPTRLLDTAALAGSDMVRTWVYHNTLKAPGAVTKRTTRVDVQRGGGYGGAVTLSLNGLPGTVGSAAYLDGVLDNRNQLGTRLDLTLKLNGPDGVYDLGVKANGSGVSADSKLLPLKVDRTGPKISGPKPRIQGSRTAIGTKRATTTQIKWAVSDKLSKVAWAKLQRKTSGGDWVDVGNPSNKGAPISIKPGTTYKLRVKSKDTLGNSSTSGVLSARLLVFDSKNGAWRLSGSGWKHKPRATALGGSILKANGKTASARIKVSGKAVALASPIGPTRGKLRVRIDGGAWEKISLYASKDADRRVVWSHKLPSGTHTVQVQGVKGKSAVDALLVIQ